MCLERSIEMFQSGCHCGNLLGKCLALNEINLASERRASTGYCSTEVLAEMIHFEMPETHFGDIFYSAIQFSEFLNDLRADSKSVAIKPCYNSLPCVWVISAHCGN